MAKKWNWRQKKIIFLTDKIGISNEEIVPKREIKNVTEFSNKTDRVKKD